MSVQQITHQREIQILCIIYSLRVILSLLSFYLTLSIKKIFWQKRLIKQDSVGKVESVKETNRVETVYCCEVPKTHSFVLEDFILVGNCFGCDESGTWNKLAEKCGFPKFKEWNTSYKVQSQKIEIDLEQTLPQMLNSMKSGYNPWPSNRKWRGFSGQLINKVGGILVDDIRTKGVSVFFPVYIGEHLRGGVKAAMKKDKFNLSYVTTKGNWVKKYGLFLFEPVRALNKNYVIIVEGPRDALRLYEQGLPAIAILGSQNFGAQKALLVSSLYPDFVLCMPDNDKAGSHMKKLVKDHMGKLCPTYSIRLPEDVNDPMDMSDEDIIGLKRYIRGLT